MKNRLCLSLSLLFTYNLIDNFVSEKIISYKSCMKEFCWKQNFQKHQFPKSFFLQQKYYRLVHNYSMPFLLNIFNLY